MQYRCLRSEPRVGIANFTMDFVKGQIYNEGEGRNEVPSHIAKYLCSHGILADSEVSLEPAASPDPSPRPKQAILVEGKQPMGAPSESA